MSIDWIEISADYLCNNRCPGCPALQEGGPSMSTAEAVAVLRDARRRGATGFWFGGGEPTLRKDFLKLVYAAKKLGYSQIKVQTNGMLLAHEANVARLEAAGATDVSLQIKGAEPELHDRLAATEGCFARLEQAARLLAAAPALRVEADVLLYEDNVGTLPAIVDHFFELGVTRFSLWHLSVFGLDDTTREQVAPMMPTLSAVSEALCSILDDPREGPAPEIIALHMLPCVLPRRHWGSLFRPASLRLEVADPGGYRFPLEDSPYESGPFLERCSECAERDNCDGPREDYIEVHGDSEIEPIG
jgi:molybdenum cofactor biosynthesis enzyme MoaA